MINDGREFLIKRRRGNSAKCSAFSLWRSQSENRVPRGCSGSRRCFLFTAVPGGPHRRRARFIPYPLRNVGGTFYVRYGTNQTVSVPKQLGGRGGAATPGPGRALLHTCSAVGTDGPRTCRFWYLLDRWGDEQHHT